MDLNADNSALHAAALWSGLILLLLVALSVPVALSRRRNKIGVGDGGLESLNLRARAFGNASEYAPAIIGALILLALVGYEAWVLHALGATFLVGRVLHAWGISRSSGASLGRVVGMALTWTAYVVAAGALIVCALTT